MANSFIKFANKLFGYDQTSPKPDSSESIKEKMPTKEKNKESISFEEIKSFFSFKKKSGEVLNTKTTVTSTTTTEVLKSSIPIHPPVEQIKPEHFVLKTTQSGVQYQQKEILLKASNINLSYGDKVILRDVNLEVRDVVRPGVQQGQIISIVGQSGMGKTQLFKILAGLNEIPTKESERVSGRELTGQVLIGRDLHNVNAGDVGVITQDYIMFNHRTVIANFNLAVAKNNAFKDKDKDDLIKMYTDKFNLSEHLKKYPMQMSGGQRQRAAIVQQLLCGGDFILFDEPFSGLDIKMIKKTLAVLKSVSMENEDRTLIIISHDIATSCSISDHVFILGAEVGKPGATIKKKIDLMERDLAWKDENKIRKDQTFLSTIEEVEEII